MPILRSENAKVISASRDRSESVRKPCAMVPPKGEALARSASTWIHWKSSIALAKVSMRSCEISSQGETPTSSPTRRSSSRKEDMLPLEPREVGLALLEEGRHRLLRLGRIQPLAENLHFLGDRL